VNSAGVPSVAAFVQVSYAPTDQPPTGMITSPSSDVTIGAGQSVSFAGTASDPDGTVASYSWVFPGGSPAASSVQNPGAVGFLSPGTFRASLTATDNLGLNDPSPPTRLITVVPGFSLSATPVSRTVLPGTTTSYQITVTPGSGFAGTVNFGLSGLPTGASGSFNPATVSNSGSTTLSVATGSSTPPGSYPLTMTGNSGVVTETVTATLVVGGSFAISVSPASNTIARGASGTYKLTVSPGRGFSGVVTFGVIGLPSKTLATFNPKSVTNGGSSTLTVRPGLQTPVGSYTLQIGGVSGGVVRSANATLTIQ